MQQVENDEGHQEHSAPAHRPRGPARLDISFGGVSDGSRRPAHARELDRRGDVKRHADEKDDPHEPEQLSVAELRPTDFPEESGVGVDLIRSGEDLEIAEHVGDHEADEDDAGDRHHDLLPDHSVPEGGHAVAGNHASGGHVSVKRDRRIQIRWVLHTHLHSLRCFIKGPLVGVPEDDHLLFCHLAHRPGNPADPIARLPPPATTCAPPAAASSIQDFTSGST